MKKPCKLMQFLHLNDHTAAKQFPGSPSPSPHPHPPQQKTTLDLIHLKAVHFYLYPLENEPRHMIKATVLSDIF